MRSPEEIQAEMDHLKAEGVDGRTKQMRTLREELKAAQEALESPSPIDQNIAPAGVTETAPAQVQAEVHIDASEGESPFDTDEWRFVERCLASSEFTGSRSKPKYVYQDIKAKVKTWRIIREKVVGMVGIGGDWPQWTAFGLDPDTGDPIKEKPAPKVVAPDPVPPPATTQAGDPIEARPGSNEILAQFGAEIAGTQAQFAHQEEQPVAAK